MNQSRFKALKIVMQRAQINNCPLAPIRTTLYKDSVSGKKVFVNEFKNNGEKKIISFSVRISCFDEDVKLIGTIKDYQYNDVSILFGEEFGQNKIIACPDQSINSLAIVVTHVELEDDYFWDESTGKVVSHTDSIEEEVQIEMAPLLDDMPDISREVEQSVASINVQETIPTPSVTETSERLVTPITLDTPIIAPTENISEIPVVAEPVKSVESVLEAEPVVGESSEDKPVEEKTEKKDEEKTEAALSEDNSRNETNKQQPIEVELNFDNSKKKKAKKPIPKAVKIISAIVIIAALIFVAVVALKKYSDYSNYNRGAAFMANGDYEYAMNTYAKLGDYKDAPVLLIEAKKANANALKDAGNFAGAIEEYSKIAGQEAKIAECYDAWATSLVEAGDYQAALDLVGTEGLTFSDEIVQLIRYSMGKSLYDDKYYEEAAGFFETTIGYEDSDKLLKDSHYQLALMMVNSGNYDLALEKFTLIEGYKDTTNQIKNVKYLIGKRAMDNHKYDEAIVSFEELAGYEDADELIVSCYYQHGVNSLTSFDYETAMNCFKKIEGNETYEDIEDKYTEALYKYILEDMKEAVTLETMDRLAELPKNYEDTAAISKVLKKYVDHVGEYEWMTSNDKDVNSKGGFEEHIIVTLAYNEGEVIFTVDGHPVDLKLFVYKSDTDSDTYTMLNPTTITRTFNGKIHTYKKIKE